MFMTTKDVARRWNLTERHVRYLLATGRLEGEKLYPGANWRIRASIVEGYERGR